MLNGQPQQRDRWKRGISAVEGQIGELLGEVYAQRYFPAPAKAAMADLVGNLRKAMAANLAGLAWMGPETRKEAEAKLATFMPKIGAPAKFKTYDGLTITATTPLANQIEAGKWKLNDQMRRIGKPVDRAEWFMLPQTVNAYYNPTFNEIVFPAAILQPPFFNLTADPAVNYGGDRRGDRPRDGPRLRRSGREIGRRRQPARLVDAAGQGRVRGAHRQAGRSSIPRSARSTRPAPAARPASTAG